MFVFQRQIKGINFTKKFKIEPIAFWENVLSTDESKLEIFGVKKLPKIWQTVNEES